MGFLLRISHAIDTVNTWIGKTSGWLLLLAVLISATNAVVRKVFSISSNAWLDAQWYLFGAVFMLCASYTLLKNGHVRIDLLSSRLSKRTRDLIDLFGHLFFLLPLTVLMVIECIPFALESYQQREGSANAGGLLVWPAKLIILVGFALLFVQALSEIIKRVAVLAGQLDDAELNSDTPDRPEMDLAEESLPSQDR